jgi:hypothetical protein
LELKKQEIFKQKQNLNQNYTTNIQEKLEKAMAERDKEREVEKLKLTKVQNDLEQEN